LAIIGQHVFFLKQEQHQTMEQLASVIPIVTTDFDQAAIQYMLNTILWIHCAPL